MDTARERIEIDDPILLARGRSAWVRQHAVEINPRAYTAEETDARVMEWATVTMEVLHRYDIDVTREYQIDWIAGVVTYGD